MAPFQEFSSDPGAVPRDDAAQAHRRRAAKIAVEVGHSLGITGPLVRVLDQAANLPRTGEIAREGLARLASAVRTPPPASAAVAAPDVDPEVATVLALLRGDRTAPRTPALELVAEIVRICEVLDEQLEALPSDRDMDTILEELESIAAVEGVRPALVDSLRGLRYRGEAPHVQFSRRLPVQVQLAQQVFRTLGGRREVEVRDLEALALRDPVLAGSLIQVANSALYGAERRIGTVRQAIVYIGTMAARHVLMAAVMRPLFASAGLVRIWSHGVRMGQLYAALAGQTGMVEPGEATLLGLVHDVGALAVQLLPGPVMKRYHRLTADGYCPPAYVERLLFGYDHGEIGAGVLGGWCFPEPLIEAVKLHHQPERSPSAATALLYLAEFWSGLDEDLPSFPRVEECCRRTGVSLECLASLRVPEDELYRLRIVE